MSNQNFFKTIDAKDCKQVKDNVLTYESGQNYIIKPSISPKPTNIAPDIQINNNKENNRNFQNESFRSPLPMKSPINNLTQINPLKISQQNTFGKIPQTTYIEPQETLPLPNILNYPTNSYLNVYESKLHDIPLHSNCNLSFSNNFTSANFFSENKYGDRKSFTYQTERDQLLDKSSNLNGSDLLPKDNTERIKYLHDQILEAKKFNYDLNNTEIKTIPKERNEYQQISHDLKYEQISFMPSIILPTPIKDDYASNFFRNHKSKPANTIKAPNQMRDLNYNSNRKIDINSLLLRSELKRKEPIMANMKITSPLKDNCYTYYVDCEFTAKKDKIYTITLPKNSYGKKLKLALIEQMCKDTDQSKDLLPESTDDFALMSYGRLVFDFSILNEENEFPNNTKFYGYYKRIEIPKTDDYFESAVPDYVPKTNKFSLTPSIDYLAEMSENQLKFIPSFCVYNKHGLVRFTEPVDITYLNLDEIISIDEYFISVYNNNVKKPARGKKLNVSFELEFYNIASTPWTKEDIERLGAKLLSYENGIMKLFIKI